MSSLPLPEDIISNILSRLPVKSIIRFRCVCKSWRRLICHPTFIKLHLDHETEKENFSLLWDYKSEVCSTDYNYVPSSRLLSSVLYNEAVNVDCIVDAELELKFYRDYERQMRGRFCDNYFSKDGFTFVSSCNGVVCFTAPSVVVLWNPSTMTTRKIRCQNGSIGFGCDSETGEFKMVEITKINPVKRKRRDAGGYSSNREDWENSLRIYSFESNSWKVIPKISYKMTSYKIFFFKGAFHWLARPADGSKDSKQVLASFVMHDASFQEVPLPQLFHTVTRPSDGSDTTMCVLGGCLALTYTLYKVRTEIWVMKDHGGSNSWTELCTMDLPTICEHPVWSFSFIRSFKNGELLFQKHPDHQDGTDLFLYDPIRGMGRAVDIQGMPPEFQKYYIYISFNSYIRTLVSVSSNTSKEATERMMSLRSYRNNRLLEP